MTLAFSVPFLTDLLLRIAKTPVASDAQVFLNRSTAFEELEVGDTIKLKLGVVGLSPACVSVTQCIFNRKIVTDVFAGMKWTVPDAALKTNDQIDYKLYGRTRNTGEDATILNASILDLKDDIGWSLESGASGAFGVLFSTPTTAVAAAANSTEGSVQIGA